MRAAVVLRSIVLPIGMLVLGAQAAVAQTPAQIAAALAIMNGPAVIDGLILSPIQRKNLEFVRRAGGSDGQPQSAEDQLLGGETATLPDNLVVSGVVIRSGNRSTVWVNDQPLYGQGGESPLRTQAGRAGVLQPGVRDLQLKVKPGQTVDVQTRQATDLLPHGSIKIIPPKASSRTTGKQEQ